jgi:hypothetical protein
LQAIVQREPLQPRHTISRVFTAPVVCCVFVLK